MSLNQAQSWQARLNRVVGSASKHMAAGDSWKYMRFHFVSQTWRSNPPVWSCFSLAWPLEPLLVLETCCLHNFVWRIQQLFLTIICEYHFDLTTLSVLMQFHQAWHFCLRDFNANCGKLQHGRPAPKLHPKRKRRRQSHQRRWLALKSGANSRPKPMCPGRCFIFFSWTWFQGSLFDAKPSLDCALFFGCSFRAKDHNKCSARIWNDGLGGQCPEARSTNNALCEEHQRPGGFTKKELGPSGCGVFYIWCFWCNLV